MVEIVSIWHWCWRAAIDSIEIYTINSFIKKQDNKNTVIIIGASTGSPKSFIK